VIGQSQNDRVIAMIAPLVAKPNGSYIRTTTKADVMYLGILIYFYGQHNEWRRRADFGLN